MKLSIGVVKIIKPSENMGLWLHGRHLLIILHVIITLQISCVNLYRSRSMWHGFLFAWYIAAYCYYLVCAINPLLDTCRTKIVFVNVSRWVRK